MLIHSQICFISPSLYRLRSPSNDLRMRRLFPAGFTLTVPACFCLPGLIILNAWYGKFVTDNSKRHERAKVIDVTVPLQCLVKDSKLILTEATKVSPESDVPRTVRILSLGARPAP